MSNLHQLEAVVHGGETHFQVSKTINTIKRQRVD